MCKPLIFLPVFENVYVVLSDVIFICLFVVVVVFVVVL